MTQLLFYHLLFQCNIKIQVTTVFAADAVARMSGTIGVAAVTAGPGKELKMDTRTKIRCDKIESVPNDGQIDNMFKGHSHDFTQFFFRFLMSSTCTMLQ